MPEMPVSKDKSSIATVVPKDLKDRLQKIADLKKWTMSQTVKECLELFIDAWEESLGIPEEKPPTTSKKRK